MDCYDKTQWQVRCLINRSIIDHDGPGLTNCIDYDELMKNLAEICGKAKEYDAIVKTRDKEQKGK